MFGRTNKPFMLFLAFSILALVLAGCGSRQAQTAVMGGMGTVSQVTVTDSIETTGNLGASQLVTLTWGTSGLVEKTNVVVGQKVKAGDVLAILRADSVPADVVVAQADLAAAQRDLDELINTSLTLSQAQLAVITARKDVEEAENIYNALNYPRASDTLIKNAEAKIKAAEHNLVLLTRKYKEVQHHADGDPQKTAALLAMTNAQLELNDLKATLNWYIAKPSEADFEEAKINLEIARATLEEAREKRDRVKDGADPLDVAAAEAKVAAAQAKVDAMAIIAPFDGEVLVIHTQPGSAVEAKDSAIGLVNRDTIKIDTQIDETSIAAVALGNTAEITMDSLPGVTLKGVVTLIDPIGTTVNGLVKYTVTVAVETTDQPVLFGATATVTLITSEPRSMLAVPIRAVQTDADGEYVLKLNAGGAPERVDITSGNLSGNLVTLTNAGDLMEGDQVQLGSSSTGSESDGGSTSPSGPGGPGGGPFGIGG